MLLAGALAQVCAAFLPLHPAKVSLALVPRVGSCCAAPTRRRHAAPSSASLSKEGSSKHRYARFHFGSLLVCRGSLLAVKTDLSVARLSAKIQQLNKDVWEARLASLEQQAISDFQKAIREFSPEGSTPVLTTALIAGDQGTFLVS